MIVAIREARISAVLCRIKLKVINFVVKVRKILNLDSFVIDKVESFLSMNGGYSQGGGRGTSVPFPPPSMKP